jgi:hypothetical protein
MISLIFRLIAFTMIALVAICVIAVWLFIQVAVLLSHVIRSRLRS